MRVGTSSFQQQKFTACTDHPHACGDKRLLKDFSQREKGSSPCVWGQDLDLYHMACQVRIIPMRVGTRLR